MFEISAAVKAADRRLAQAARGELALAADVRLDLKAVIRLLWTLRKAALAQWKAAKVAAPAPVAEVPVDVEDDVPLFV